MHRRAKVGIAFLAIAIVGPTLAWLKWRPAPVVEFLEGRPDVEVFARGEFVGKPWLDWKAPGGNRITFPKKRRLVGDWVDPAASGFLQFRSSMKMPRFAGFMSHFLEKNGERFYLSPVGLDDPSSPAAPAAAPAFRSGVSARTIVYSLPTATTQAGLTLPFATDEKFRDVDLVADDGKRYPIRLQVSREFGPPQRRAETFKVGAYKIYAKPKEWKYTTEDMSFEVTTDAPKGTRYLFKPKFKQKGKDPWSVADTNQPRVIVAGEGPAILPIRRIQPTTEFDGSIVELVPEKIVLKAGWAKKNDLRLYLPSGDLVYAQGMPRHLLKHGIEMLECRGRRLIEGTWGGARVAKETFSKIKAGPVEAIAYRAKKVYPISGEFDRPPKMNPNRPYVFFTMASGTGGTYIISYGP